MALRDPVSVYNAASNVDAHLVKMRLIEQGIEAVAIEDVSLVGYWMLGMLPEIHKPQVWVNATDLEQARPILQDYEAQVADRHKLPGTEDALPVEVVCEECGEPSSFPSSQRGSVQLCPRCFAYVDVGEMDENDAYWVEPDDDDEPERTKPSE